MIFNSMGRFAAALFIIFVNFCVVSGIGVNWGAQASHPLSPSTVVQILRDNGIEKLKLFGAEERVLRALKNSGVEVMVGIQNDMLPALAADMAAAEKWVAMNVSSFVNDGVNISFDASYDTLVWALKKNGFDNVSIMVGEIGWPTDGALNANVMYAQKFNQGILNHVAKGTPMRPGAMEVYLFSLIDEDEKSIQPGNFERHWGILGFDGRAKYELKIGIGEIVSAKRVEYLEKRWCVMKQSVSLTDPNLASSVSFACGNADCTSLGYKSSCSDLDARGNVSYAFNSYYQKNDQDDGACEFSGLGTVTDHDPSTQSCRFNVMIEVSKGVSWRIGGEKEVGFGLVMAALIGLLFLMMV